MGRDLQFLRPVHSTAVELNDVHIVGILLGKGFQDVAKALVVEMGALPEE